MALVVVATVGSASANSYVTLAEADAYVESRLNASTWTAATDDTKNRALVEATRELDILPWQGNRVTETQALSWPREWAVNPDDPNLDYFDTDVIPVRAKDACMELAFQFVKAGTADVASVEASDGVIRKRVDVLETEYARPGERLTGLRRYPRVWDRVKILFGHAVGPNIDLVRG